MPAQFLTDPELIEDSRGFVVRGHTPILPAIVVCECGRWNRIETPGEEPGG
jgi:hypothetical protein